MKIGDTVFLKSDLEFSNPMTVQDIEQLSIIDERLFCYCVWIDEMKQLQKATFHIDTLQTKTITTKPNFKKIPLLLAHGVYGLKVYSSLLASSWKDNQETKNEHEKDTRFVYNFKKYGKNKEIVKQLIELIAFDLECTDIIAVPPHTKEPNEMQLLFNSLHFTRIQETPPRKYNHKSSLPPDYAESYLIDFSTLEGNKILLIDDVCNSGATLNHFAERLTNEGYQVFKFSIGLDYKLKPIQAKEMLCIL